MSAPSPRPTVNTCMSLGRRVRWPNSKSACFSTRTGPSSLATSHQGQFLGYLGAILGLSWGHLGAILGCLRPSSGYLGTILGLSWAVLGHLGLSWGYLGAILGLSWAVLGHLGLSWGYLWAISRWKNENIEKSCVAGNNIDPKMVARGQFPRSNSDEMVQKWYFHLGSVAKSFRGVRVRDSHFEPLGCRNRPSK